MTAWIVILWRFAATYVRAKHNRAEMLNSNRGITKVEWNLAGPDPNNYYT